MSVSRRLRLVLALAPFLAVLLGLAGTAEARLRFEIRDSSGTAYVEVSGDFEFEDDLAAFSRMIRDKKPKFVTFDSPGGNIAKALELGRLIRKAGLATFGSRRLECDSACAFAFMGGIQRTADDNSIGMHKASLATPESVSVEEAVSTIQDLTARVIAYMTEMGIDPGILEVALTYESSDIRYLTSGEMQRYRVTNAEAAGTFVTSDGTDSDSPADTTPPDDSASGDDGDQPSTLTRTGDAPPRSGMPNDTQTATLETDRPTPDLASPLSNSPSSTSSDSGFSVPAATSGRVRSTAGAASLRSVATPGSRVMGELPNGTPIKILDARGTYYRVSTPKGTGYLADVDVFVDQFQGGPFETRYIQVGNFKDYADAEAFVKDSSLPLVAALARDGSFSVTLEKTYSAAASKALLAKLKDRGLLPDDAFVTYGNTYVRTVCCQ